MNETKYVVKVHGKEVSPRVASASLAEHYIANLDLSHQAIAEVVSVTSDGKEVLLG